MNKKGVFGTIIIFIVIALVVSGGIFIAVRQQEEAFGVLPSPVGGQFISNEDDVNSIYTKIIDAGNYVCDADECIISGSMEISKALSLEGWRCTRCGSVSCSESTIHPNRVTCDGSGCFIGSTSGSHCIEVSSNLFEASFNFCPAADPNFKFCTGTENSVSSTEPRTYFAGEKRLIRGESVSFQPKNSDGTDVTERFIRTRNYDLSCLPAIDEGTACLSNQILCKPQESNNCPAGFNFDSRVFCRHLDGGEDIFRQITNVCWRDISGGWEECRTPISDFTKYNKCDSTQTIGQSTCGAFSSTLVSAPTGQECFLFDANGLLTNQRGEGIGGLACPGDPCSLGQRRGNDGSTVFEECVQLGKCNVFSSRSCAGGLFYNIETSDCEFPSETACNPQEAECVGIGAVRHCERIEAGGKVGYQWAESAIECLGELQCFDNDNLIPDDFCSCEEVNEPFTTDVKCLTTTTFEEYAKDPNNPNSCFEYRNLGGNTIPSQICEGNELVTRGGCKFDNPECDEGFLCNPDVGISGVCELAGCGELTAGFECSEQTDNLGVQLEFCQINSCVENVDDSTATLEDLTTSSRRCFGNTIHKVFAYTPIDRGENLGEKTFYRWEVDILAENSIVGVCINDFICTEEIPNMARCITTFDFVGILTSDSIGVDVIIKDVKIVITNNVPGFPTVPITTWISADGVEIIETRTTTLTDSNGEALIDFEYAHPRVGTIKINVIAGETGGVTFNAIKEINIANRLKLLLNCDQGGFVERDISCEWTIEDADTQKLEVATQTNIQITQGIDILSFTTVGLTGLVFQTDKIGSAEVSVEVNKDGFIGDSQSALVSIQKTQLTQEFFVDNLDIFTLSGSGVTTGTHQLKLRIEEVGIIPDVLFIDADMITPSGQEVALNFKQEGEFWVTSFNFVQAGTTYRLVGSFTFVDQTRPQELIGYTIPTTGSRGEEETSSLTLFLIIGGIALLTIIIIIVMIVLVRRNRR